MITSRDNTNASRAWKGLYVRTASGLVQAKTMRVRDASNTSRSVLASLAATASPATVYGYGFSSSAIAITTSMTTAVVTGGTAPTYAWSGGASGWTINSPTAATTTFTKSTVGGGAAFSTSFVCTITDGTQTTSVTVYANVANNYNS